MNALHFPEIVTLGAAATHAFQISLILQPWRRGCHAPLITVFSNAETDDFIGFFLLQMLNWSSGVAYGAEQFTFPMFTASPDKANNRFLADNMRVIRH